MKVSVNRSHYIYVLMFFVSKIKPNAFFLTRKDETQGTNIENGAENTYTLIEFLFNSRMQFFVCNQICNILSTIILMYLNIFLIVHMPYTIDLQLKLPGA